MELEIIKYVITQSIGLGLFLWLFFDTRKDSKQREIKYQETIEKLADKFGIVETIKEKIDKIEDKIFK